MTTPRRIATLALIGALSVTLTSCTDGTDSTENKPSGSSSSSSDSEKTGTASGKVALLLPETKTARYENMDKPMFEAALMKACSACELIYSNADQDAAKQQQQAEAALTQGAKVLVLDPVDGKSAETIVNQAKAKNVPVIAYDRLIKNADYYVSFDNAKVGELQGTALVDLMKKAGKTSGDIVMINGSPTDPNAAMFKKGAHSVLDSSGFKVAAEFDTPDWSPDKAQQWMEGQLSKVKENLVGVYAANDGTAGGAIAAMKGGGIKDLPPVTGQDAELAGIQRIVSGDQGMTVYKAIKPEAENAAAAAIAFLEGKKPNSTTDVEGVPATLLKPIAVTQDNIKDTVVADGFYTIDKICTADFKEACNKLGLK